MNGAGKIVVNDVEMRVKREDIMLIEPNDVHKMINDTDDVFEWLEFKMHDPSEEDIFFLDD